MKWLALCALSCFVVLVPFENMLLIGGVGTLSRIVGLIAFTLGLGAILDTGRLRVESIHLWGAVFVASAAASFLWSVDPQSTADRVITYVQLLGAVWLITQLVTEEWHLEALIAAYVLGAWVALLGTFHSFARGADSFYQRFAATGFNPNDLAYILALGIPLAWYLRARTKAPVRWLYIVYPVAALTGILLTASRGGLFAAAIALAFVAVTTRPLRLAAVLGGLVVGSLLFFEYAALPYQGIGRLATIGHELFGGTLNQRTLIWAAGLAVSAQNPLLGVGAGAFPTSVAPNFGAEMAPHNAVVSLLVEQGALGLAAFLGFVGAIFRRLERLPRTERRLWFSVLAVLAVALAMGNWEWRKQTWVILALAATHASLLPSGSVKAALAARS